MDWLIVLTPFFINIIIICRGSIGAIFFLPLSLIIGLIILAIFKNHKMSDYPEDSKEYKKLKKERDEAIGGAIIGGLSGFHYTKKGIRDVTDVDHW